MAVLLTMLTSRITLLKTLFEHIGLNVHRSLVVVGTCDRLQDNMFTTAQHDIARVGQARMNQEVMGRNQEYEGCCIEFIPN